MKECRLNRIKNMKQSQYHSESMGQSQTEDNVLFDSTDYSLGE